MKILLVVDGSSYSEMATRTLKALRLPSRTEVTVMTVVPEHIFLGGITLDKITGASVKKEAQQQKATELIQGPVQALSASRLKVKSLVQWGNPTEIILNVARESDASLVVMGAKGLTDPPKFLLGNVAQKVMNHANASVLLVREKAATATEASLSRGKTTDINRVLLATDGSKYADAAILFLLNLPLPRHTEVIVITALQSHLEAWIKTPTLDFRTNQELLAILQADEEHEARKITTKAEKQFQTKVYKTASIVMRGGAAKCILVAAKKYKPDIIVLGSRGLSGIKALLLGSVAERVARYANCSVLIGRASSIDGKEVTKVVRVTKTIAESRLGDVPQGEQFWCQDGRVLKSLPELGVALKQMDEETFRHHSSESRNDFSNWVRDVIGDKKLSRDLLKSTTQAQAAKSVDDRVAWLKSI